MEELIKAFHLDGKILVAQLVNFSVVFFLFYKLAYRPVLEKMNARTEKIEKGLKDAAKSAEILENSQKTREEKILLAKKEAGEILEKTRILAEKNRKELAEKARAESQKIIEETKQQLAGEKEKVLREIKLEIADLLEIGLKKILKEKNLREGDQQSVVQAAEEINQRIK